jgi:hypothetical protein
MSAEDLLVVLSMALLVVAAMLYDSALLWAGFIIAGIALGLSIASKVRK